MKTLFGYLKNYKKQLILGPSFKLTEAIFELIVPLVMAEIIDVGVKNRDIAYVFYMGFVLLGLGAIGLGAAMICQWFASVASQGFGTTLRSEVFAKINSFSHKEIDAFTTGSLITRLTGDINQLQFAVAMLIRLVIRAPFLAIGAIIMAAFIDLKLSIIFLVVVPMIILVLYFIMNRSIPFFRLLQNKVDTISLFTRENLEGIRVIRAFSKQEQQDKRFQEASEQLTKTALTVGRLSALLNPLTYVIMNLAIVAILWFGGFGVDSGRMTQGEIIAFVNYMTQILLALTVVANLVVIFTKAWASAGRVCELLNCNPSVVETVENFNQPPNTTNSIIDFKDVCFSYALQKSALVKHTLVKRALVKHTTEEDYALKNISFSIAHGETVGIIGGTGSGKSTLIALMERFYDVNQGEILVDGVEISKYPLSLLRGKFGLVPQNAVLFSGTIEQNLRWGNAEATTEQLHSALVKAQAWEFVEQLPAGLNTIIEQNAKNLSGGQKQRLTIARALVRSPGILILDDSSSALDYATDAKLRSAIADHSEDKTVIIVAQRIRSIIDCDKIIVLEDGLIADIGKHDELFARCEIYRDIFLSQQSL